jgi:hypothetical protein
LKPRFFILTAALLGLGWLVNALVGHAVGRVAVAHFDHAITSMGGSKVPDHADYVAHRLTDGLWLLTLVWIGALVSEVALTYAGRSRSRLAPWLAGAFLFVALNVGCLLAGRTALFWLILRGTSVENQAQFHAKENLLREIKIRPVLVLVGSSQVQKQFTEETFNAQVGGKAWMVECHYPGSCAEDVFYIGERFPGNRVNAFVYYMSSPVLYSLGRDSSSARDLLRLRDLPETLSLNSWHFFLPTTARYAALGMISPLFQYRSALQHALLGPTALPPKITAAPKPDTTPLTGFGFGPETDYQKAAFRRFVEHSARKGQRVIVIVGQMNPAYEARIPPEIHRDFEAFLTSCAAAYPNLTLIPQDDLLVEPPDDYVDDAHVNDDTSDLFTKAFAQWYLAHPLTPLTPAR